jgi:hypothetical protein
MPRVGASVIFGAAGVSVAGAPVVGFLLSDMGVSFDFASIVGASVVIVSVVRVSVILGSAVVGVGAPVVGVGAPVVGASVTTKVEIYYLISR